jgi:flagellin-like hook-associated protein FlgL
VGDEMAFYAIDTTPGVTRGTDNWGDMTFPTGGASPIQTTVAVGPNDNIYFGANNRTLYAYQDNGASGTELGTFQTGSGGTDNFGRCSPVVNTANRVFFASGDGNAYALDGTDPANWGTAATPGTALEWVGDLNGASKSTPALSADGSIAYVGSDDNKLYAFTDPATGFQLDNTSVTFAKDYLQGTDTLAAGDISLTGTAATGISVSGAPVINANGTVTVTLAGTATSAGTITIATTKAGLPHLAAIPNLGTGYPTTMTAPEIAALGVAITPDASGGSPGVAGTLAGTVTGVNGDGSLNLTFAGTATIGGDFTITVDAGPAEGTAGDQAVSVTTATTVTVGTFDVTQTGAINKTLTNVALKGTTTTPEKFNVTQAGAINQTLTNIALKGTTVTPEKFNVTQTGAIAQTLTNLALKGSTPTPGTFNVTQAGAVSQTLTNLAVQGSMPTPLSLKLTQGTASDVNVAAIQGSMSPQTLTVTDSGTVVETEGLLNEDLDLWDFTVSDFTRYIQVVANVMAVNGAETSSLAFSQSLLRNNFENLELATSRITDTDVAHEMAQLAKNRIKTSTAADMLAKHNKLGMMVDLTVMNLA